MWNLKTYTNELIYKAETHRHRKQTYGYQRGKGRGVVQFSPVAQSCPTLCDPMDCSTPGLPVCHQLPEFAPTHVYRVHDAIQPPHPLSPTSPPVFNLSQCQGLFK